MKKTILRKLGKMSQWMFGTLFIVCLFSNMMYASEPAEAQNIRDLYIQVHEGRNDLTQLFDAIENQTDLRFVYPASLNQEVSIAFFSPKDSVSVVELLTGIAAETGLWFRQMNSTIAVNTEHVWPDARAGEVIAPGQVQDNEVTGRVLDLETGEALPGVNVIVAGSEEETGSIIGTQTDMDGSYSIHVPDELNTLVFTYIGYQRLEVNIDGRSEIDVQLQQDIQMLDDVVVVGYGVQDKVSLTNSVAQIQGDEIVQRPVANVQQSLQGLAPGVTVVDRGGPPGSNNVNIRIRGVTTLGNNNPLIIIDGMEQRLTDINPNDIESISILKDASSTAIYGSRAANGVVLITTKRGQEGRLNITYDGYYALQDAINRPQHMDVENYLRLENIAHENAGRTIPYSEDYIQEYVANSPSPEYPLPFPFFRRDNLGMLKTAPQQNHTLSVSGGTETIRGRMSVRYQDIDGIVPNFSNEVNEFRLNTDLNTPDNNIRFSADINYRSRIRMTPVGGEYQVFNWMTHASKFAWPKYETGEYGLGPQGNNPLLFAEHAGEERYRNDYLTGSIRGEIEILRGLRFSTQYALRYSNTQNKHFRNRYFNRDPLNGRIAQRQMNSLNEYRGSLTEYTLNTLLTYTENFRQHGITALVGYSTIHNQQNSINGFREGFFNNQVRSLSQGSSANINATGSDQEFGLRSFFSRLNYDYDQKYLFEVNARYDGSSRFSKENRYSFFPSFSGGWRLSSEDFWKDLRVYINELKVRGSWGITGNQAVGLYTYFESLSSSTYSFNDEPVFGYAQTNLANTELTWETTTQTNIGFDTELWNSRVLFTFDYYNKITDDILLSLPIPGVIGLSAPVQNAGSVQNKGYEIALDVRGGNELEYSFRFNFSDNRNKVLDLADTGPFISGGFITKEGLPIDSHWGYIADGVFQSEHEIENYPTLFSNTQPGDVRYVDLNEDGVINDDDKINLGLTFPQYDFGATMNFTYKNFGLLMNWQGAAGHKTHIEAGFAHIASQEAFTHAIYTDNFWTPDRPDARFPRPIKGNSTTNHEKSSQFYLINADYIRLKNLVLSYNIPSSITDRFSIRNARVYTGATNLLTFSRLNEWNLDPEFPSGRGSYYPQVAIYSLGINLSF